MQWIYEVCMLTIDKKQIQGIPLFHKNYLPANLHRFDVIGPPFSNLSGFSLDCLCFAELLNIFTISVTDGYKNGILFNIAEKHNKTFK